MKILWLAVIGLLLLPAAHADMVIGELGSLNGEPTDIVSVDFDKNGVPDTAVVGTVSGATAVGAYSWTRDVQSVEAVVAVDLDSDGYLDEVVAVGRDIVAFDSSGNELWRADTYRGYSGVAADLDNDGHANEVVAGCWNRISAFDSSGNSLWNFTDASGNIKDIVLTENYIIGGAGRTLYAVSFNGELKWGKAVSNPILGLVAVDFEGSGTPNGVIVLTSADSDADVEAYTMYGGKKDWSIGSQYHDGDIDVSVFSVDKQSKGNLNYALFNLDLGIYWVSTTGAIQQKLSINYPTALSPIDLDGDGVLDDAIIGTRSSASTAGKIYVYTAIGQAIENTNITGADTITAVDLDFDGKADDAIAISNHDKRIRTVITTISDTTTSTAPVTTTPPPTTTPAPTTTAPPTTTPAPTTTAPSTTTVAPATTAPAAVTDNATAEDTDFDGWTDALEAQMGTDPKNPDTDGDGILDGKDPNPLVAGSSGSIMDRIPDTLITAVKWIVIIGGGIIAIIFIREKILDFMWERNQDWGEG